MRHRGARGGFQRRFMRAAVLMLAMGPSLAAQRDNSSQAPSSDAGEPIAPWERMVGGAYENKGLAQIERLGNRWVLNVMCDGIHATYIDDTDIDLAAYSKGYVGARYRYVDRVKDTKCFQAPCPPAHERRIAIERLTIVTASPEQARETARDCRSPAAR